MMKKVWLILMAMVLVFGLALLGCGSSSSGGPGDGEGEVEGNFEDLWDGQWVEGTPAKGPGTLELIDNFQYGTGYQGEIKWGDLLNENIKNLDVYQLDIVFTVSRDLEDDLQWAIVDKSPKWGTNQYWGPLGRYKTIVNGPDEEEPGTAVQEPDPPDGAVTPNPTGDVIKAGETITYKGRLLINPHDAPKSSSWLVFTTTGAGVKGTGGSGVKKPVTLTFTKFEISKLGWGEAPEGPGESTEGNLGLPAYGGTGDSQAAWEGISGNMYDTIVTAGTKLVVTFKNEIAGGIQIVWQDPASWGWYQNDILTDSGEGNPEYGTSISEDKKTLTIDLSKALKDYGVANGFADKTAKTKSVKLILAYYTGENKMKGLEVVKADLVAAESSGDFKPVTGIGFTGKGSIQEDETLDLSANVVPSNATNKTIVWSATNGSITNGVFTPAAVGDATITMTIANGATATTAFTRTVTVKVTAKPVVGIPFVVTVVKDYTTHNEQSGNFENWIVDVSDLAAANYFVFKTDGSQASANKDGFGGVKIGWQRNSGAYGMSGGITAQGWTSMDRTGVCYFFISLADIEDYTETPAYDDDEQVRFYIGYWNVFAELATTGAAQLVTLTGSLPEGIVKIENDDGVFGFAITEEDLEAALED
jgi:hypothetical protein